MLAKEVVGRSTADALRTLRRIHRIFVGTERTLGVSRCDAYAGGSPCLHPAGATPTSSTRTKPGLWLRVLLSNRRRS
jgi:hypothetical protein